MRIDTKYNVGDYVCVIYRDEADAKWKVLGYGKVVGMVLNIHSYTFDENHSIMYDIVPEPLDYSNMFGSREVFPNKVQAAEECKHRNISKGVWKDFTDGNTDQI